jgi:transposase
VTALSSRMATRAARRLGLVPTCAHRDSPSVHVDGRYNRAEEPDTSVMHSTRGDSRDHRPALHHVRLALIVAHQAGIPLLMPPRSGHTSEAIDCRPVITAHMAQRHLTSGTADLVADSALYHAENLRP